MENNTKINDKILRLNQCIPGTNSNVCSCLLSPTDPAPHSRCVGEQVARLLARLRVDLWTLLGENCTGGWRQLPVALVPPQAGWLQQHLCRYLLHLWLEAQKKAPLQKCQGPRASIGPSVGTRLPLRTELRKALG